MSIDTHRLLQITDGDVSVQQELIGLYFDTVNRNMPVLHDTSDANDHEWREAGHELKGASNTLGFERVGNICRQMELMRELKEVGKQAIVKELEDAIAEIRSFAEAIK